MIKSKKTIIYMLVALFVAVSVAFVDAGSIYAKSYSEDVQDADWVFYHVFDKDKNVNGELSKPAEFPDWFDNIPQSDLPVGNKKYVEHADRFCLVNDSIFCERITIASDNEIVVVFDYNTDYGIYYLSVSNIVGDYYHASKENLSDLWHYNGLQNSDHKSDNDGDYFYKFYPQNYNYGSFIYGIRSYKMKVFYSYDDAKKYLTTGDTSNMAWQGSTPKQTYSPELAFTSFDMSVHDSNSFDDYYLEFLYKCPEEWLGKNPKLVISQTWDYNVFYFDNKGTSSPLTVDGSNTCALSVSGNNNSVKIPLGQLDCLKKVVTDNFLGQSSAMKRCILGSSFTMSNGRYFTFNGLPIMADGSCKVDKSLLSLSCVVYVDGVAGHEYVGSVDLITGDNSMATYTPDTSGNYTFNDDYKKGGHYYTNVGKDAAGNTTYNYYYYTTDNSKHEVTSQDSHDNTYTTTESPVGGGGGTASGDNSNNNVNNPTFNNNITIEGDTINNDVNNYVGNNTSSETNKNFIEKFLGFFQLLENNSFLGVWGKVFGWLPPGISSVITTALGIGACVGLFRFFRR